ncbi:MAG: TIGR04282 family arsenosugar biosynthesis glycosyltransferase [Nitrospira sp.]|nr:TIGR04282 family arsenosugar biosynthesis glycosyltransferase [Nitrospira sp.]
MGDPKPSTQPASPAQRGEHSAFNTALVIFAKAPIPGQVKTRLCPPLTPDEAATLHGSFVIDTLERIKVAASKLKLPLDRYLACAPSATHVFFKIMEERQSVKLLDQIGDNLGARMNQAFKTLFAQGYRQVMLMGTDVPTLPLDHVKQALTSLENHDLVLGPAFDGGYYLIGLKRMAPELFVDIPWSTDQVLRLTQKKAAEIGLKVSLISPWRDVDTLADLEALIEACAAETNKTKNERSFSARTTGVLETLAKRLRSRA